jgi:hypothetical protein
LSLKVVHNWTANVSLMTKSLKPMCVNGWQQSNDFYATGFDALVKRSDKCVNAGGGYIERQIFFPCSNVTCFMFYINLWYIYFGYQT